MVVSIEKLSIFRPHGENVPFIKRGKLVILNSLAYWNPKTSTAQRGIPTQIPSVCGYMERLKLNWTCLVIMYISFRKIYSGIDCRIGCRRTWRLPRLVELWCTSSLSQRTKRMQCQARWVYYESDLNRWTTH